MVLNIRIVDVKNWITNMKKKPTTHTNQFLFVHFLIFLRANFESFAFFDYRGPKYEIFPT